MTPDELRALADALSGERIAGMLDAEEAQVCEDAAGYLRAQAAPQIDYRALYHDLLFAVGNKHAGETRHETALRYIREAERSDGAALAAKDEK